MKNLFFSAALILLLLPMFIGTGMGFSFAQSSAVPFTLEDRDRIMQTQKEVASLRNEMNTRFESMQKEMNTRFESMNTRFESQQKEVSSLRSEMNTRFDTLYWAFGIIVALVLFQLGYTIWDRRTTLYPLLEKTYQLSEKSEQLKREVDDLKELKRLKEVIKEYAQTDTKLAELLRRAAIL